MYCKKLLAGLWVELPDIKVWYYCSCSCCSVSSPQQYSSPADFRCPPGLRAAQLSHQLSTLAATLGVAHTANWSLYFSHVPYKTKDQIPGPNT